MTAADSFRPNGGSRPLPADRRSRSSADFRPIEVSSRKSAGSGLTGGSARYVGRVGALAVALGIGAAVTAPALAGADTTGFPNYPRMRRRTTVVRDQSGGRDRTTITVRVTDPALRDTVSVTALVASP